MKKLACHILQSLTLNYLWKSTDKKMFCIGHCTTSSSHSFGIIYGKGLMRFMNIVNTKIYNNYRNLPLHENENPSKLHNNHPFAI